MYYPIIKELRSKFNYTQEYLGEVLGIEQSDYSRLENGKRELRTQELKALCKLYNVNSEDILNNAQTSQVATKTDHLSIYANSLQKAEEQRELLINVLIQKGQRDEQLIKELVTILGKKQEE